MNGIDFVTDQKNDLMLGGFLSLFPYSHKKFPVSL